MQSTILDILSKDGVIHCDPTIVNGLIKDGKREGEWEFSFSDDLTVVCKGNYENGKPVGTWIGYYLGTKKISLEFYLDYDSKLVRAKYYDLEGNLTADNSYPLEA